MIFQLRLPFYPLPITQVSKQFKEIFINKFNHTLSGILLSAGIVTVKYPAIGMNLLHPSVLESAMPLAGGALVGSVFPDIDIRIPGLEHRTITHWPVIYGTGLVLSYFAGYLWLFFFCIGCLVHILLDSLSLMGVPLLNPFGKRRGFKLMVVGGYAEALCSVIILIGIFCVWVVAHNNNIWRLIYD